MARDSLCVEEQSPSPVGADGECRRAFLRAAGF